MKNKKGMLFLVALFVLFCMITNIGIVNAADNISGDYTYTVNADNTTVTITGYRGSGGDIVIPSVLDEKAVTSIEEWTFSGCNSIKNVTISNGIQSIGGYAFCDCNGLMSIKVPSSVTNIGEGAFSKCTLLSEINVDEGSLNFTSFDGVLFNNDQTTLIQCPAGKTERYIIPDSVTTIGEGAFYGCINLNSVIIPNNVKTIGVAAFEESGLTNITIPNSINAINWGTFCDCGKLTDIYISDSVTKIDGQAFEACNKLSKIKMPDSIVYIGERAFARCDELQDVTMSKNVRVMGEGVFWLCVKLTNITIPNSICTIPDGTFDNCDALTSIDIPYGVTTIGDGAFHNCTSLKNIELPNSLETIENQAFINCSALTSITIPNSVSSMEDSAFADCGLTNITIPASVTNIGTSVFSNSKLTGIYVDDNNPNYKSIDGVLFNKQGTILLEYPNAKPGEKYKIPNGVTTIDVAFRDCALLKSVTIPNSVISIKSGAFNNCKLTKVIIPSSVTSIGNAFYDCYSLRSIYFAGNAPSTFGTSAFESCNSDFKIYYKANSTGFTSPTWNGYNTAIYGDSRFIVNVMDSCTWEPVEGAIVKVGDQTAVTDEDGTAELLGITPGDADISITKKNVNTSSGECAYEDFSDKCNIAANNGNYFTFLDPVEQ